MRIEPRRHEVVDKRAALQLGIASLNELASEPAVFLCLHSRKKQILEQVHWIEANAALVDRLKYFERAANVRGNLNEHDVVREITPIPPQLLAICVIVLEIFEYRGVGREQVFQRTLLTQNLLR